MTHDPSFLGDEGEGGIRGDRGYTAQAVVLLHRLPLLFDDAEFEGVVLEGQEDFDLHFQRHGRKQLHVVQCKAKGLTNVDVRELLDGMYARYQSDPDVYEKFEIVARHFPAKVEAVRNAANTLAVTATAYDGTAAIAATEKNYRERIVDMLAELRRTNEIPSDWVEKYLKFCTKIPSFPFVENEVIDPFASQCTDCRQFGVQILAPFRIAASEIHQKLRLNLRNLLTRQELAKAVHDACIHYKERVKREGVKIHIDHWRDQNGRAVATADQVFNWREHYESAKPSGIPALHIMQELLTDLQSFEGKSMTVWSEAEVQLLQPCSISAAFAIGHTYRRTKGYTLSVTIAGDTSWTFDEALAPAPEVNLNKLLDTCGESSQVVSVGLGIGWDISRTVKKFTSENNIDDGLLIYRSSLDRLPSQKFASKVAMEFVEILRSLRSSGVHEMNIFFAGPIALAAMIGTLMNRIGKVNIYEMDYQENYQKAFEIST